MGRGDLDGKPVTWPYPVSSPFEKQRAGAAAISETVYCYDFLELFSRALEIEWSAYDKQRRGGRGAAKKRPSRVLIATELILRPKKAALQPNHHDASLDSEDSAAGEFSSPTTKANASGAAPASAAHSFGAPGSPSAKPPLPGKLHRSASVFIDQYSNEMSGGSSSMHSMHANLGGGGGFSAPNSASKATATPSAPAAAGKAAALPKPLLRPEDYELVETSRAPGLNDIGIVAWRITIFTPQYGEESGGREIVLIANDITFRAGSFGTEEDRLFELASALARSKGIPRIFLAANSGARIGLAEEVKKLFKVAWTDPAEPSKGFKYLYLTPTDYATLCGAGIASPGMSGGDFLGGSHVEGAAAPGGGGVGGGGAGRKGINGSPAAALPSLPEASPLLGQCGDALPSSQAPSTSPYPVLVRREVLPSGEERFIITDVIGREADLGVENLRGSGTIAGETSRAYSTSFTLTYVTGRTVGIGAYLVRLGQRCIQKVSCAPIILTGYEALNKLMGADVYSSNEQLGGTKIMFTNGVSHELVENDFEGVLSILRWLAFVPKAKGAPLPTMDCLPGDDPSRDVEFEPPSGPFDPRLLLAGLTPSPSAPAAAPGTAPSPAAGATPREGGAGASAGSSWSDGWVSGLFDKGSFRECMGGWAKSVVTGRARLGGYPMGVVIPELRTVTAVSPADPAAPASQETVTSQAGQVWFPDSAFKTAQALRDFAGEDLPVLIVANWRGFSGGQRDMFNEVLKFGSYIVDALVATTQPVFVYIPPRGELRGGAWVVVDPTINPEAMEMYSDPTGRGGVLEPSGMVAIKYRKQELAATALRLDPALISLEAAAKAAQPGTPAAAEAARAFSARSDMLSGIVLQVAHSFADLHDTPGRMLAKGVINGVVPWRRAREFFYWRLRRRLTEGSLCRRMCSAAPQITPANATTLLRTWYLSSLASQGVRVAGEALESLLWKEDKRVLQWLAENTDFLTGRISSLRRESIAETVLSLGKEDFSAVVSGVLAMLARLPSLERESALGSLRRGLIFGDSASSPSLPAHRSPPAAASQGSSTFFIGQ